MANTNVIGFAQEKVTIGEGEYTLQKIPFKSYLDLNDRCTNKNGRLSKSMYLTEIFKSCVVSPRVTLDDFDDDFNSAMELAEAVERFLNSKSEQVSDTSESQG